MRAVLVVIALLTLGCDLFKPYCDDLGVYPDCRRVDGGWRCPTSGMRVCNTNGYEAQYDCGDYGGTYCIVR